MRFFWQGFDRGRSPSLCFKKHVIILLWNPQAPAGYFHKDRFVKTALTYPTVLVKIINIEKEPDRVAKLRVENTPTVILLRNGREVGRSKHPNQTVLEQYFRRAII